MMEGDFNLPSLSITKDFLFHHFATNVKSEHPIFSPDRLTRASAYEKPLTPAAVLIPIIEFAEELHLLFTKRSDGLRKHAGQISFPGGRIESDDIDAIYAALRESEEEIGLTQNQVTVIGRMGKYITGTGFEVTPIIGLVASDFHPICAPGEVDCTLTVPLNYLMNPAHYELRSMQTGADEHRTFYSLTYGAHHIWGATAAILMGLYDSFIQTQQSINNDFF